MFGAAVKMPFYDVFTPILEFLGSNLSSASHDSFLLMCTLRGSRRRLKDWVPVPRWETHTEFKAPTFSLAQPWLLAIVMGDTYLPPTDPAPPHLSKNNNNNNTALEL